MISKYPERRRFARVPITGPMLWRSRDEQGVCQVRDLSPEGAAFDSPDHASPDLGQQLSLDIPLDAEVSWSVTDDARVIRKAGSHDGYCRLAVAFADKDG